MKKVISILILFFVVVSIAFTQSDLQVVAQVNFSRKDPITLGQVKKIIMGLEKTAGRKLTFEERKQVLDGVISQRLLLQASEKAGVAVLSSEITEFFNNLLSSQVGVRITEAEFAKKIKQEYNQSLDQFFKSNLGVTVDEVKKDLKEQIAIQKYVMSKKGAELQKMSVPSDGDIRRQYELNKQSFFRPDTMKLIIIGVMKKGNDAKEIEQINKLNTQAKKNAKNIIKIQNNAQKEGYRAEVRYAIKNAEGAQMLGLQQEALMQMFEKPVNFVSDITDMPDNRQFFVITEKNDAKVLSLSDVIDPNQTITVYEYIKGYLAQQLQAGALQQINKQLTNELRTSENTKVSMSDAELKKALSF